ncbi:MAG: hypothetical protein IJU50_01535, partial [Lachnospiraceae bacterium]|nr:hypothetical protein [Lachnospiraceae bacterium]
HPELFWVDTSYGGKYTGAGELVEILLSFNRTAGDLEASKANFERGAEVFLEDAREMEGEEEKERFIHDALAERLSYNMGADLNQSAYSALVGDSTVCAGYSRAMQYLLMQLEIPCYYCTGYAGEAHAWNILRVDDAWYNADLTWDDAQGGYGFYNKSDSDYASTHIRTELAVYLPPCGDSMNLQGSIGGGETNENPAGDNGSGQGGSGEAVLDSPLSITRTRRTLEEAGAQDLPVFSSLDAYYQDCREEILSHGLGEFEFSNVVQGEKLFGEIYSDYAHDFYKEAYMDEVMEELEAEFAEIRFDSEQLEGGYYLIRHRLSIL